MNKKIVFIADFFVDQISGGGELNNEELIDMLRGKDYNVEKIQSHFVDEQFLEKNRESFFIISNFLGIKHHLREHLCDYDYVIYEHDHKYIKERDPATHFKFQAPPTSIVNYFFYKHALAVLCQSTFHQNILELNLNIDNVINLSGNLWSLGSLEKMRDITRKPKKDRYSIMDSKINHKNTIGAISYCNDKKCEYELIQDSNYFNFLEKLGSNKRFVFLPKTPETLSRVIVEARMMGNIILTNGLVGAAEETWFQLKGEELIDYMIGKREDILSTIEGLIKDPNEKSRPLVSMITTFCDGGDFLEGFMENITNQTIFSKCELIIVDANSLGEERDVIATYMEKYDNIIYHRLDEKLKPTPCINIASMLASGKYLSWSFLDDIKSMDCIEVLLGEIEEHKMDLVYGDVIVSNKYITNFNEVKSKSSLHNSSLDFSRENMIKCLPGPMPLYKASMHDRCGFFDTVNCDYADDWEMWLRAVNNGCVFRKVNKTVGVYLSGGRSQQNEIAQREEEARVFYKYSHIFGNNFKKFKSYFDQFIRK
jgi:GT2 family glycosyltransferase